MTVVAFLEALAEFIGIAELLTGISMIGALIGAPTIVLPAGAVLFCC